ncbi:MAG: HAMP domain-containing histidine kinase [Methylocapsa sp.]|nr:HAMP domain-containing histidine kinase [Methylocapsa sp.]
MRTLPKREKAVKHRGADFEPARAGGLAGKIAKDHFFAHASHEIRAPLNAIAGFAELLANCGGTLPGPDKQREYAKIIHQSAQHLLSIVNAITDMSLIQSGSVQVTLEQIDAAQQIDFCCGMFALQARQRGIALLRAYLPALGPVVCDRRLFTQILANLVSNAIKFTPAGGRVTIEARAKAATFVVRVTDTGTGINAADLSRLGNPFFQGKNSSGGQGTGLGISIVCGLIGALGGGLKIASEPGRGTCVEIRLPVDGRAAARARAGPVTIATAPKVTCSEVPITNQRAVKKIA